MLFLYIINLIVKNNIGGVMYYLNSFLVYSLIGFLMESAIFKINSIDSYSGFMIGPVTPIYGIGVIIILLVDKYIIENIKCSGFMRLIFRFIIFSLLLSIIEFLGGFLLDKIFRIELWNYSSKRFNIGKYICLELSFIWGLLSVLYIYFIKSFIDRFINKIPRKYTIIFFIIFLFDIFFVICKKIT